MPKPLCSLLYSTIVLHATALTSYGQVHSNAEGNMFSEEGCTAVPLVQPEILSIGCYKIYIRWNFILTD